jgi:hypothetical protein
MAGRPHPKAGVIPQIVVSVLAIAAAVVHVAVPSAKIDATTLALVAIAALPWLAPVLQSITLPGGFELVLRDIHERVGEVKAQVDESSRRVEKLAAEVEQLRFQGEPVPAGRREELSIAVAEFRAFLSACGLAVPKSAPTVKVDPDAPQPYYIGGEDPQIVIAPDTPPEDAYRLYAHHVLGAVYPEHPGGNSQVAVQYGLAFYFTGSHEKQAVAFDDALAGLALKEALAEAATQPEEPFRPGAAWAQLLWQLRDVLTPSVADHAYAMAWTGTDNVDADWGQAFGAELIEVIRRIGTAEQVASVARELRAQSIAV